MSVIRVWHGIKHDGATVTDFPEGDNPNAAFTECPSAKLVKVRVFILEDGDIPAFVPFHRINYIQALVDEEDE